MRGHDKNGRITGERKIYIKTEASHKTQKLFLTTVFAVEVQHEADVSVQHWAVGEYH